MSLGWQTNGGEVLFEIWKREVQRPNASGGGGVKVEGGGVGVEGVGSRQLVGSRIIVPRGMAKIHPLVRTFFRQTYMKEADGLIEMVKIIIPT